MSAPCILDYLPQHSEYFTKLAAPEEPIKHPYRHMAKTVGVGLLGLGTGLAAGAGAVRLGELLTGKTVAQTVPSLLKYMVPAGAVMGVAAGKLYDKWKKEELAELQRAWKSRHNRA